MREPTRREVLASTVAIGAAGLAGCVSGGDDDDSENGDDTGSGNGDQDTDDGTGDQDTDDGTGDQDTDDSDGENGPDVSIETVAAECGSSEDETADVEFGEDAIAITGTTPAPNPCHEAYVESVSVEDGSFSLTVNVREDLGDGEACASCQGAIDYEAQIRPDDASTITEGTVEHVQGGTYGVGVTRDSDGASSDETGSAGVTDASIQTTDAGCRSGDGQGRDEVSLSRQDSGFLIDGEITVPTPCHEATLAPVELENGTLALDVGVQSTSEMCQDCLGLVEYEAVVELDDPGSVDAIAVSHPDDERYLLDPTEAQ